MNKLPACFLAFALLLIVHKTLAQETQEPGSQIPLHRFLQANHDTTIILTFSTSDLSHSYYIVSKFGDRVALYTYLNPYGAYWRYPDTLFRKFLREYGKFASTLPDTNRYFLPYSCFSPGEPRAAWDSLATCSLFTIKDDAIEGGGCGKNNTCDIDDGITIGVLLITKTSMKRLRFYAPDYYETCCPSREGRRNALKAHRLFKQLFRHAPVSL